MVINLTLKSTDFSQKRSYSLKSTGRLKCEMTVLPVRPNLPEYSRLIINNHGNVTYLEVAEVEGQSCGIQL